MKEFPPRLDVRYKDQLKDYLYNRTIAYLRRDLFELIIRENGQCLALDEWFREKNYTNKDNIELMTKTVMKELETIGWTCNTSYGGTALFVYADKDNPPKAYFPDGF